MSGRLAQRFYVITAEPTETAAARSVATDAHLAWLADLQARGVLLLAGPFCDERGVSTGGGMFIIRAASLADAEAIAATDPYNAHRFRIAHVRPWRVDQAQASLVQTLSQGSDP
ncbi:MAG: YciI family protein [Proteobacteria bacterium]|nr:YciI family protein [Pseudomonadota bacterium]